MHTSSVPGRACVASGCYTSLDPLERRIPGVTSASLFGIAIGRVGNLTLVGPFPTPANALAWTADDPVHRVGQLITVEPVEDQPEDASHVLCVGDPFDGMRFFGPIDASDPDWVANEFSDTTWWIVNLEKPDEYPTTA